MGAAEKVDSAMPFWPEAMGRRMALAYTQVSADQLRAWEEKGMIRFFQGGRNGQRLVMRDELKKALESLASTTTADDWFD